MPAARARGPTGGPSARRKVEKQELMGGKELAQGLVGEVYPEGDLGRPARQGD